MKKLITYIFIPILAVLLMSHNVGALEVTQNVDILYYGSASPSCSYNMLRSSDNTNVWSSWTNDVSPTYGINVDYTQVNYWSCRQGNSPVSMSFQTGDIVEVYFFVRDNEATQQSSYFDGSGALQRWQYYLNGFRIISAEQVGITQNVNDRYTYWRAYISINGNFNSESVNIPISVSVTNLAFTQQSWVRTLGWTAYRPKSGVDYSTAINDIKNSTNEIKDAIENQQQQEEDAVQDAADESATAGQDSSDQAASATTGLISAIGGFVSAITNASPSNCNINANLNHINLGVLDMCSMPVPSYITIIGTIIAIMLVIPFCIVMFNRFIGLFRSFQG